MWRLRVLVISMLLLLPSVSMSDDSKGGAIDDGFHVNPVILDSKNGTGSTLGLEYKFKGELFSKSFESSDSDSLNPDATLGSAVVGYSGRGTVAASKDRNPKNFLEFLLDAKLKYSASQAGTALAGAFAKYEANQSFSSKQFVFGLAATYGKYGLVSDNDFLSIDANLGRVDPIDDIQRKTALGTSTLDGYNRWSAEILYMYPLKWKVIEAVELNYRYFLENDAPIQIKNAGLDKHDLATVRIGLQGDFFVAYSVGKLPFDRRSDQVFMAGFSYKLQ